MGFRLDKLSLLSYALSMRAVARCAFPRLRAALGTLVFGFVSISCCCTPYGPIGVFSETKIAVDVYRVSLSTYGYTSWDFAYQAGLLRCATLTIQNGYRNFGVLAIENYGAGNSFILPGNRYNSGAANAHEFYNANTIYNLPQSYSIIWPEPVLTIKMLRAPVPGVTLDAVAIRNRGMIEIGR